MPRGIFGISSMFSENLLCGHNIMFEFPKQITMLRCQNRCSDRPNCRLTWPCNYFNSHYKIHTIDSNIHMKRRKTQNAKPVSKLPHTYFFRKLLLKKIALKWQAFFSFTWNSLVTPINGVTLFKKKSTILQIITVLLVVSIRKAPLLKYLSNKCAIFLIVAQSEFRLYPIDFDWALIMRSFFPLFRTDDITKPFEWKVKQSFRRWVDWNNWILTIKC